MSSGAPSGGDVLSLRALNRATLARQLLLQRHELPVPEAVERLFGLQSQAPDPPYYALWTRLDRFDPEQLGRLVTDRQVVRLALMRGTIHLVTARDGLMLRPLVQPVLTRTFNANHGKRLVDVDHASVAAAARQFLEEEPLTFAQLGARLAPRWPDRDPAALAQAARALLPLVQVPPRGVWGASGPAAHTTAESWLGAALEPEPSPEAMVVRYLAAYGPATVQDIQAWSGLTGLRSVVARLADQLRPFRDEQGRTLLDLPDAPRPDPDTPAPVRFIGEFDNLLLSHADRARVITEEHRRAVFTINGIIRATILVDGVVRGRWTITREAGTATLVVQPFAELTRADRSALTEEGARLLAFAAAEADSHDIRFAPPP